MAAGPWRVYLMRRGDLHKIGKSKNPAVRAAALVTGEGRPEILHSFPCGHARPVERLLHDHFTAKRVRGEWFRLDPADVALVCSIAACDGPSGLPEPIRSAEAAPRRLWGKSHERRPGKAGLYLELDAELLARLRELAEANGRTVTAEAAHALERHLAAPPAVSVTVDVPPLDAAPKRPRSRPRGTAG